MRSAIIIFLVLLTACAEHQRTMAPRGPVTPAPGAVGAALEFDLHPSMVHEQGRIQAEVREALKHVGRWFGTHGFSVDPRRLISRVVVFHDRPSARAHLARRFKIKPEQIPAGFSATVDGDVLLLMGREHVRANFARLYPRMPWEEGEYRRLMIHELAHRAHALIATRIFGTEDGMGPVWLFEGLAIACAGQFGRAPEAFFTWPELEGLIAEDKKKRLHYPLYRRMFQSLSASFPVERLIRQAGHKGFPASLEAEYLPNRAASQPSSRR